MLDGEKLKKLREDDKAAKPSCSDHDQQPLELPP
jgi:hypothetical protein